MMNNSPLETRSQMQRSLIRSFSPALMLPCLVILLTSIDLVGWLIHLPLLTSVISHSSTMKPNTAICLFLLAIICLLRRRSGAWTSEAWRAITLSLIALTLVLSFGTLLEYASARNFGIDQLFLAVPPDAFGAPPGRMALGTAASLTAMTFALLLLDAAAFLTTWTLLAVNVLANFALLGFAINRGPLFRVPWLKSLAVHTALCLLMLSVAALALRPERQPVALLVRFAYSKGKERPTAAAFTLILVLVVLPTSIAMRTGFMDAGMALIGVLLVLLTLQMLNQFWESLKMGDSSK